jgi:glycosyltransferase A (GT-A) superfamily protein (DUF2064 family)
MQILVMAKSPVPGRVKTRLCPPCTPAQAASIAGAALEDTLDAAIATGLPVVLALDGPVTAAIGRRPVAVIAQRGVSFNDRLEHAWCSLRDGGVQVGMDTPQLTADRLLAAVDLLVDAPAVLGPADDGGWWCLGLRRPRPGAFAGVPMSSARTGAAQRTRLAELGCPPMLLPALRDVDTWDDATAVARDVPHTAFARAVAHAALGQRAVAAP